MTAMLKAAAARHDILKFPAAVHEACVAVHQIRHRGHGEGTAEHVHVRRPYSFDRRPDQTAGRSRHVWTAL
ncbi:hypothetical protein, partial [Prescottella equi]|uniref:hypothetical protein n=1 Tax=Rhodococcus hoagii TaxID=43767 RepID=UPI00197CEF44